MAGSNAIAPGYSAANLPPGATGDNTASVDTNEGQGGRYINNPSNPTSPVLTFQPGSWAPDNTGTNVFTPAPAKPVGAISTTQGAEVVQKNQQQATTLAGTPPVTTTDTTKTTDTGKDTTDSNAGTSISLVNPDTGQSIKFAGSSLDQATVQKYMDAGYHLSEAEGTLPSWLGPTGTTANPALDTANTALTTAKATLDSAVSKLTGFDVSNDPQLKSMLDGITQQWNQRITDMQNAEQSRIAALTTTGIRMGSQWTGGAGGVTGSIISAEERAAVDAIAGLQIQKTQALASAQQAFASGKWTQYNNLVTIAQNAYDKQLAQVQTLQKAQATQDAKIQAASTTASMNSTVAGLYAKGITDPTAILKNLRDSGDTTTTLAQIGTAIKNISPSSSSSDNFKFSSSQMSQLLAAGLNKDEMQALHDYYNGTGDASALSSLPEDQQQAVHDVLNGTAAKKAASTVPTYAQLHPKTTGGKSSTYKSGGLTYSGTDVSDGVSKLNASKNEGPEADGVYSDPNLYLQMAQAWTSQGGYIKDFLKNYPISSYINPENTTVTPAINKLIKQDAAATKTTSTEVVNPFATGK